MSTNSLPGDVVRVSETSRGRFQVEAHIEERCLLIDEPVESGGLGSGPDPYDLIGSALGACTAMTLRLYAGRKGWGLKRVHVEVRHRRDSLNARDVFETGILLEGALDESQRARLREIAERCPVHLTLARGADLHTSLLTGEMAPAQPAAQPRIHARCMQEACAD